MIRFRMAATLAACVAPALLAAPAQALFHQWNFTEFFSNADGTVQFIELQCGNFNNEHIATAGQIRSLSTGNVYTFPANLPSTATANKFMLIATDNFESLPGAVTPEFPTLAPLPANFFNPAGDTISLVVNPFGTVDSPTFTALAPVPTDGVTSRHYPSNTVATNTPTNFAGAAGSMNLAPPVTTGDYNGDLTVDAADYTVWRDTLGQVVAEGSGADGDADGMVDAGDYDFWKGNFGSVIPPGAAAVSTVPEPTAWVLALGALLATSCSRRLSR